MSLSRKPYGSSQSEVKSTTKRTLLEEMVGRLTEMVSITENNLDLGQKVLIVNRFNVCSINFNDVTVKWKRL